MNDADLNVTILDTFISYNESIVAMCVFHEMFPYEQDGMSTGSKHSHTCLQKCLHYLTEPPQVLPVDFGSEAFYEGDLAQANCVLRKGDPPLVFTWLFNGVTLVNTDDTQITGVGARTSILTLDPVNAHHQGNYECVAQNAAGITRSQANLIVNGTLKKFMEWVTMLVLTKFRTLSCVKWLLEFFDNWVVVSPCSSRGKKCRNDMECRNSTLNVLQYKLNSL